MLINELLIEDIKSFKERGIGIGVNRISLELAYYLRSGLTPHLKFYSYF